MSLMMTILQYGIRLDIYSISLRSLMKEFLKSGNPKSLFHLEKELAVFELLKNGPMIQVSMNGSLTRKAWKWRFSTSGKSSWIWNIHAVKDLRV